VIGILGCALRRLTGPHVRRVKMGSRHFIYTNFFNAAESPMPLYRVWSGLSRHVFLFSLFFTFSFPGINNQIVDHNFDFPSIWPFFTDRTKVYKYPWAQACFPNNHRSIITDH